MRLVTFRAMNASGDRVGAITDEGILDLSGASGGAAAFASMQALIEAGPEALEQARTLVRRMPSEWLVKEDWNLRPPLPVPIQFRDSMTFDKHIEQSFRASMLLQGRAKGDAGAMASAEAAAAAFTLPEIYKRQAVWYKGNRLNVSGPGDTITWPPFSQLMDFELELCAVIGKKGKNIQRENALDHVFGFTIFNDLSARDVQAIEMKGMLGPAKSKDFDQANVFGPCITTLDEIGDPQDLKMSARVNGELWGEGSSADMRWTFADLISQISLGETLYPGELIASGTVGDGCGLEQGRFLGDGDTIELTIETIGTLTNRVVRPSA